MFTGIVEAMADVLKKREDGLVLQRPASFDDIKIGSSICVSGVCLSVIEFDDESMRFDVVPETFRCSKLGALEVGDKINLERAMQANGRFEGHIVQGHVESTSALKLKIDTGQLIMTFCIPTDLHPFIIPKGSITLDGVSLTVASVDEEMFSVALIPHTIENTTLGLLQEGDVVNVETDILGKYIIQK